jgi:poly(A) polymerase
MAATGILSELLPGALQLPRLEKLTELDAATGLAADPVLRLAALLPDGEEAAQAAAVALKLSNADRDRLAGAVGAEKIAAHLSAQQARQLLYRWGAARFSDTVRLQWAQSATGAGAWRMLLQMANNWQRPRFPLTGRDVMAAGVVEGPEVGRVLAALEDWWIEGDFAADEGALRSRLKAVLAQGQP